ncbi:hypothetical protein Skr01_16360 [Sphaerisporangium krabiense]|nr:hypothetical protein Skr01_16360 [Sphaerisporangium krabiense]
MKIVGIAGSLLSRAYVRGLLEAAGAELPGPADLWIWEGLERVPPVAEGEIPPPVRDLCQALTAADGAIIAAPAHSVLPRQLEDALEWTSSAHGAWPLLGKPVVVVTCGARPYESMWTQTVLHRALGAAGASVHSAELVVPAGAPVFDAGGRIVHPASRESLRAALGRLRVSPLTVSSPQLN